MKNLTLIIHANIQQALADVLRAMPQVQGFTITQVEGHGAQNNHDSLLAARDQVVGYTSRIRVQVMLESVAVAEVLDALRASDCGVAGRGVYWVTEVEAFGRL